MEWRIHFQTDHTIRTHILLKGCVCWACMNKSGHIQFGRVVKGDGESIGRCCCVIAIRSTDINSSGGVDTRFSGKIGVAGGLTHEGTVFIPKPMINHSRTGGGSCQLRLSTTLGFTRNGDDARSRFGEEEYRGGISATKADSLVILLDKTAELDNPRLIVGDIEFILYAVGSIVCCLPASTLNTGQPRVGINGSIKRIVVFDVGC